MEIKILCPCGAKYKFDVEPFDGKLPGPVQCPVCAADGTAVGNAVVAEALGKPAAAAPASAVASPPVAAPSTPKPVRVSVPASSNPAAGARIGGAAAAPPLPRSSKDLAPHVAPRPAAGALVPQPNAGGPRLSVSGMHATAPAPDAAVAPAAPAPIPTGAAALRPPKETYTGPSNKRGFIGAAIGGLIGMLIWAFLIVVTETEIGWVAWGVGLLTGYSAKVIGRGESTEIGIAAALAAFIAITMGQFLAVRHAVTGFMDDMAKVGYEEEMEYAREVAKLKNDQEIRIYLAKESSDDTVTVTPGQITAAEIKELKEELPRYRRMTGGSYTQADYTRENRARIGEFLTTGMIFKMSFSLWTFLWIFLGVGSAYKLASAG